MGINIASNDYQGPLRKIKPFISVSSFFLSCTECQITLSGLRPHTVSSLVSVLTKCALIKSLVKMQVLVLIFIQKYLLSIQYPLGIGLELWSLKINTHVTTALIPSQCGPVS